MSVGMHCKMSTNMVRPLSIPLLDGSEEGPLLQTVYSSLSFQSVKGPSPNLRCAWVCAGLGWGVESGTTGTTLEPYDFSGLAEVSKFSVKYSWASIQHDDI